MASGISCSAPHYLDIYKSLTHSKFDIVVIPWRRIRLLMNDGTSVLHSEKGFTRSMLFAGNRDNTLRFQGYDNYGCPIFEMYE